MLGDVVEEFALDVKRPPGELNFDLAIDASGAGKPSPIDAGFAPFRPTPVPRSPIALYLGLATMLVVAVPIGLERAMRGGSGRPPLAGA